MIKAIAVDIDGTITFQDRRLDTEAVKAVRKAENEDIPVIIATGNVLCFAETTRVLLGTSGPLIVEDGGAVYDVTNKREYTLGNLEEIDKGIKLLNKEFNVVKHTRTSDIRRAGRTLERTFDASEATRLFREKGLNLVAIDSGFAIHIKNPDINKGAALRKAASLLDIRKSDIAAIGDAQNDIEMFETAGESFALYNSHSKLKEIADHVLNKAHGSGVRVAIEKIIQDKKSIN